MSFEICSVIFTFSFLDLILSAWASVQLPCFLLWLYYIFLHIIKNTFSGLDSLFILHNILLFIKYPQEITELTFPSVLIGSLVFQSGVEVRSSIGRKIYIFTFCCEHVHVYGLCHPLYHSIEGDIEVSCNSSILSVVGMSSYSQKFGALSNTKVLVSIS